MYQELEEAGKKQFTIDQIYEKIGNMGKYQMRCVAIFMIHYYLLSTLLMTPGLLFQAPKFLCHGRNCSLKDACEQGPPYIIDPNDHTMSMTREYRLFCGEKAQIAAFGESAPFFGSLIGQILFMYVADNYGRRFTIFICFILGFIDGKQRAVAICLLYIIWGIAEMMIYPSSLFVQNWRTYVLIFLGIPLFIGNIVVYFLIETPKYHYVKSKQKAIDCINIMNKINNGENAKDFVVNDLIDPDSNTSGTGEQRTYSYIDLFRYKSVRKISLALFVYSFGTHAVYYGIQFSLNSIGSSFAQNSLYTGIGDFFGYGLSGKLYVKQNRIFMPENKIVLLCDWYFKYKTVERKKYTLILWNITCVLCMCQILASPPESCNHPDVMSLAAVARFLLSCVFTFLMLWSNELYPTTVRSCGLGIVFGFGLFGGYLSPFIVNFSVNSLSLNPVLTLGLIGIVCGIGAFFLRETYDIELLDEIEEMTTKKPKEN